MTTPISSLVPQLPGVGYGNRGPEAWGAQIAACCPTPSASTAATGGCGPSAGSCPGFSNYLVVNGAYLGATELGTYCEPYRTISAALLAITSDNVAVLIAPGTYREDLTIPPTFSGISLLGSGQANTIIAGSGTLAQPLVTISPTVDTVESLEIADLTIDSQQDALALLVDGSAALQAGLASAFYRGMFLRNVTLRVQDAAPGIAILQSFIALDVRDCLFEGDRFLALPFEIRNVHEGRIVSTQASAIRVNYDELTYTPARFARGEIVLTGGTRVAGNLTIRGRASIRCDKGVFANNIDASSLTIIDQSGPTIEFHGEQGTRDGGSATFDLPGIALGDNVVLSLRGALLYSTTQVTSLGGFLGGVQNVDLRDADLYGTLVMVGPGTVQVDFRGSQATATPRFVSIGPAHIVDRDSAVFDNVDYAIAGNFPVVFGVSPPFALAEPPFPVGALYAVTTQFVGPNPPAVFSDLPVVTISSDTGFTMTAPSVTPDLRLNIVLTRNPG